MTAGLLAEAEIAAQVRNLRLQRHWSQVDLAEKMTSVGFPMHQMTVSKLETNRRPIRAAEVYALASVFGVPPQFLWQQPIVPLSVDEITAAIRELAALLTTTAAHIEYTNANGQVAS